jgi:hypothetical protein
MVQQSSARPEVDVGRMTDPRGDSCERLMRSPSETRLSVAMAFADRSMTRETPLTEKRL